jgi:hypothetical protein
LLPLDWVIGVVPPVAVAWEMEVAGAVEFEEVACAVEVAVEVGQGTRMERGGVSNENAGAEVGDWEELNGSELSLDMTNWWIMPRKSKAK